MTMAIFFVLLISIIASADSQKWKQIPGGLKQITASVNYLWGVNLADMIYMCPQPCTKGNWRNIDGRLSKIDASDMEIWGTNSGNRIYRRSINAAGPWVLVGGRGIDVSASGNGYVFLIGTDRLLYKCQKPCTRNWVRVNGKNNLKEVDAGYSQVYVVDNSNKVYSRPIDCSGSWGNVGTMSSITVGANYLYGAKENKVYRCKLPCSDARSWEKMSVNGANNIVQIEASVNSLVAVNSRYEIFRIPLTISVSAQPKVQQVQQQPSMGNEEMKGMLKNLKGMKF